MATLSLKKRLQNHWCSCFNRAVVFFIGMMILQALSAKGLDSTNKKLQSPPPRIIRTCCAFGLKVSLLRLPIKITEISSVEKLGRHRYLGNSAEKNGIIYTHRGGFIDLGHVRDQADWTAYLYAQILKHQPVGEWTQKIGYEGGLKLLSVDIPRNLTENDIAKLASKIAYDLSVWHEIATWFGASTVPLMPERYSSFSVEDAYSNLLGITLGMKAIQSELPYEEAMTQLIDETLCDLEAVGSEAETEAAMESVKEIWWSNKKTLPSRNVLIARELKLYPTVRPWLIPLQKLSNNAHSLNVPQTDILGQSLSDYYCLSIKLNYKFPFKKIFINRSERVITQKDFGILLQYAEKELNESKNGRLEQDSM